MAANINHWVPVFGMGQKTHQQCWFASYQMIFWSQGLNINSVRTRLEGVIDFVDSAKNGLLDTNYEKCARALGMRSWAGRAFNHDNKKRRFFDVGLSDGAEALYALLESGPLWISRKNASGAYHITVLKGYDKSSDTFVFNNPYPGPSNALEQSMKSEAYVRGITYAMGSVQKPLSGICF
jgi:hypothetical protein